MIALLKQLRGGPSALAIAGVIVHVLAVLVSATAAWDQLPRWVLLLGR